ncbi:hypothetical protein STEG23_017925, partial [Scotinomys teguina]
MMEDGQGNPQEGLTTSNSMKSLTEMPHCRKELLSSMINTGVVIATEPAMAPTRSTAYNNMDRLKEAQDEKPGHSQPPQQLNNLNSKQKSIYNIGTGQKILSFMRSHLLIDDISACTIDVPFRKSSPVPFGYFLFSPPLGCAYFFLFKSIQDAGAYFNFLVSVETCFLTEYVFNFGECSMKRRHKLVQDRLENGSVISPDIDSEDHTSVDWVTSGCNSTS